MLFRTLCVISLLLPSSLIHAQGRPADLQQKPAYQLNAPADGSPSLPTEPAKGKWEVEDFKPTDASISCSVVQYDTSQPKPILHLLCPGPQIFAPLRVHLALTWKEATEVPVMMKNMLVDLNSLVKFKSKPGDSKAELTLHNPQDTESLKRWVSFTRVNVGLVLNPDK